MEYQRVHIKGVALVVALDICSSSAIIDQLTQVGDFSCFTELLTEIKRYLARQQKLVLFEPYKFTGDGWILLFPRSTDGHLVITFLRKLCAHYAAEYRRRVLPNLINPPATSGLSFGIDAGRVIDMTMYGRREYIGRPITVACRLQNAVKDEGGSPAYKALATRVAFRAYFEAVRGLRAFRASRILRNINDNAPFSCTQIDLLAPQSAP